ncbi:J domain-containing protein [Oscillatoria salina]|uniref:molecular chaperone DnaJ n=1 Tax=Oscillatoria salina TaxID=331517 RepID=UPI0013BE3910|nr:molecular chaperone DnaJ [Oscillatoria salina]MBZ8180426.1 molecular chaperone DnaJ [Oscillatoria salina IIICB1]NET89020.1 molecular chaperone DnaJ [Kamptonema sp. SIO1D9]
MKQNRSVQNPYEILGVTPAASKAEIAKAFMMAMKLREYSPDAIAKARKSLMNARSRLLADYLRPILPAIVRFKRKDFSELEKPAPTLEFLPEFDGLDATLAQMQKVSDADRNLGITLFSADPIKRLPPSR